MSDYSFMKAGFSNLIEPTGPTELEMLHIGGIVMAFMKNAVKSAAVYVEHANRDGITPTDIKIALQYEIFTFTEREDTPTNIRDTVEWLKQDIEEHGRLDERDDDEMEEGITGFLSDGAPIVNEEPTQSFTPSECTCILCNKINTTKQLWPQWVPTNPMENILKNAINKI